MSSQSHKLAGGAIPKKLVGQIELTSKFSQQMEQLCMSSDYSDVIFLVENVRLPAHRVILAARSEYFRALLFGGLSETTQNEIQLKIPLEAFKALLKYIYSGNMMLGQMKEENILDTLGLANQYGFTELEFAISDYLREVLSLTNVCAILDAARLFGLESLTNVCHSFMDRNASEILRHESFKNLSQESLCGLLERDSFFAPEVQIFMAVCEWCRFNRNAAADNEAVVSRVRLPLIQLEQLLSVVRASGILDPDQILDAIGEMLNSKTLPYRGALWLEENVASMKYGSRTIDGEMKSALLDGDVINYDMEKGYTRHSISENGSGILVELGSMCIINHIKILLWDRDQRSYSYFIEVSVNKESSWDRVIDHTEYNCRSWQYLYFPARAVRYIRLVGTHNTINKVFHVVALEACYTQNPEAVINGIVAPTCNIATIERSAIVVDGVSRTRNALLNGDVKNYDWDSGYTCHQLGSGIILIQLGQPFFIDSMRLLLWDCDDRYYSFFIETSTNMKNWEMCVDMRTERLRSWQHFTFDPRIVVYVKIVGTYNTANEIFHCVHFETPSQEPRFLKEKEERKLQPVPVPVPSTSSADKGQKMDEKTD